MTTTAASFGIQLRPVVPGDEPFLLRLYAGTREHELAAVGWSAEEKAAFLSLQFAAQSRHYAAFDGADYRVVVRDSGCIGRLYLTRSADRIHVVDVALLPEHRGRGIGTALLQGVIAEADAAGRSVSIHVETFNPARRLYERLGFAVQGEVSGGVYLYMSRAPRVASATSSIR